MSEAKRFHIVDEDHLRDWVLEHSPELRRDTERMADLIRDLVRHEREKLGLDNPRGKVELYLNKEKKQAADPDWIGLGRIAGRSYRVAGWISKTSSLRIAFLPRKPK